MTAQYFSDTGEVSCAASCTDIYILLYFSFFLCEDVETYEANRAKRSSKGCPCCGRKQKQQLSLSAFGCVKTKKITRCTTNFPSQGEHTGYPNRYAFATEYLKIPRWHSILLLPRRLGLKYIDAFNQRSHISVHCKRLGKS